MHCIASHTSATLTSCTCYYYYLSLPALHLIDADSSGFDRQDNAALLTPMFTRSSSLEKFEDCCSNSSACLSNSGGSDHSPVHGRTWTDIDVSKMCTTYNCVPPLLALLLLMIQALLLRYSDIASLTCCYCLLLSEWP
jgi:hypothetical protein